MFAGGLVVCKGNRCSVTMENVNFKRCCLVVIEGASATVERSQFTACVSQGYGICAMAHGPGSNLTCTDCSFSGGLQCVAVHAGAAFAGDDVKCKKSEVMGIEAKDPDTVVMLQNSCRITNIDPKRQHNSYERFYSKGLFAHQGASMKVSDCRISKCVRGVHVSGAKVTAYGTTTDGSADEGFRVEDEGQLRLYNCRSEFDWQGCWVAKAATFKAKETEVHHSHTDGFHVNMSKGGTVYLENCSMERCMHHGVSLSGTSHAQPSVTTEPELVENVFSMKGGRVVGNGKCGIFTWMGGEAQVEDVVSTENGECGFKAENFGSKLDLKNCTSTDTTAYVKEDWGRIVLQGCTPGR